MRYYSSVLVKRHTERTNEMNVHSLSLSFASYSHNYLSVNAHIHRTAAQISLRSHPNGFFCRSSDLHSIDEEEDRERRARERERRRREGTEKRQRLMLSL